MKELQVEFNVNGQVTRIICESNRTLLDVLRDHLGLIGAKDACGGEGECGACTVIMGGKLLNSCMVLIGQADGHDILTIEGVSNDDELHPLQDAFIKTGAVQCGYCTPGIILSAISLLENNPDPTEMEIKDGLSGNLCRCTGYSKIVEAVLLAAKELSHA